MKANHIIWEWSCSSISTPSIAAQHVLQTMALGIIHAHQYGNMNPLDNTRTSTKRLEGEFNPEKEDSSGGMEYQQIKDCIFQKSYAEHLAFMEIFHCWNSATLNDEIGKQEEELESCYFVRIGEIIVEDFEE